MPSRPEFGYARVGEAYIGYQSWGDGPIDLLVAGNSTVWPVELLWEQPRVVHTLERLGTFARNLWFNPRGVASSTKLGFESGFGPELVGEDISAVARAAAASRPVLVGIGDGAPAVLLYAASFPDRVSAVVVVNGFARFMRADDYPVGLAPERLEQFVDGVRANWATRALVELVAPSMADDEHWTQSWLRSQRVIGAPDEVAWGWRTMTLTNVHHVLPSIQAPTLVLHRRGDRHARVEHGRYLGEQIPGAIYRELDGDDHMLFAGNADALVDEIEEFVTGVRPAATSDRVLATVLFSDIVSSTERTAELGDGRWRKLLDAHDAVVRSQLERFRGREVNTTGDGFVATFDGPARGIRCAVELIAALRPLGLEVRVGLHTGEVDLRGEDIGGISVTTAARVQAEARPGEVCVSRTVVDLVAGSGLTFEDRGERALKGIPGTWQLFAVSSSHERPGG